MGIKEYDGGSAKNSNGKEDAMIKLSPWLEEQAIEAAAGMEKSGKNQAAIPDHDFIVSKSSEEKNFHLIGTVETEGETYYVFQKGV